MWVLGTEFWSSGRVASILKYQVISPAPVLCFLKAEISYMCVTKSKYDMPKRTDQMKNKTESFSLPHSIL